MRKIEQEMLNAIREGKHWTKDNTMVEINTRVGEDRKNYMVVLHGNPIATGYVGETPSQVAFCGWVTHTTLSRLRALGVNVYTKNWEPYVDGKKVSEHGWINVEPKSI